MSAWTDGVNPLVVKELRQGVRSRVLWGAFAFLLLICMIVASTACIAWWGQVRLNGEVYFNWFYACVSVIYLFVIPSSAYQSLIQEQDGETWAVLTLTGMGAGRILRGKIASSLLTALLYGCVVLPFLLFAYFLNGIALWVIGLMLGALLLLMVFTTFIAVCWASFGQNRLARGFLRAALIAAGLVFGGVLLGLAVACESDHFSWDRDASVAMAWTAWAMLSLCYVFYEMAVARMSLDSEDCSRGPRRAIVVQTLGFWGLSAWLPHDVDKVSFLLVTYLGIAGLFLSSDRDGVPRRLAARSRWSLFLPGALRGFRLTVLLLVGTAGVNAALQLGVAHPALEHAFTASGGVAYAAGYLAVALLVGHRIRAGALSHHLRSRIAYGLLMLLGIWPPILALVIDRTSEPWVALLSPIGALASLRDGDFKDDTALVMGLILAMGVLLVLMADHLLGQEDARSRAAPDR